MAKRTALRLEINDSQLVEQSVLGEVAPPVSRGTWRVGPDGAPSILPGVSIKSPNELANAALNTLACVGNVARVVSGEAKGAEGVVTGKHGGIEHVLVDFPDAALDALAIGDKIQVRARGLGLKILNMPQIALMNLTPELLAKMAPVRTGDALKVRVTHRIPAALMGSGLGQGHVFSGDYDIQLFDEAVVRRCGLEDLKLGDLVAVEDTDHTFGRVYMSGAVSIGVVVHSRCATAGHGPGVTSLMSSRDGKIEPVIDPSANIAGYLKIGRMRPASARRRRRRAAP